MVQVLIPTRSEDVHALAVAHVLQLQGHQPTLWYGTDFPTRQHASISISPQGEMTWGVEGPALKLDNTPFDVIWYRRAAPAVLPDKMHAGDRAVAERECKALIAALWRSLGSNTFWVNPLSSRESATSKPLQLVEASQAGLKIPPTLCSNDPDKVRRFIEKYVSSDGGVVYKAFWPAQWDMGGEGLAHLFTASVTLDDLPGDDTLRLLPGIFQPRIQKEYELRVTYMGDYQVTAKLLSQEAVAASLDWRAGFVQDEREVKIEKARLPEEVHSACKKLMDQLGIVFGCFDFIVTPRGEYIFLEVNEMGQFLWVEEINPEILMLQPFCEFIVSGNPKFDWKPSGGMWHWNELRSNILSSQIYNETSLHIAKSNPFTVCDNASGR